jgi:hypothetical protein
MKVVKVNWAVTAKEIGEYRTKEYIVLAESEETAKLRIPYGWEAVTVKRIAGEDQ